MLVSKGLVTPKPIQAIATAAEYSSELDITAEYMLCSQGTQKIN